MAINMPIQGTAADGIKLAMVRLDAAMRERHLQSRMLLQVHDELVFETDADERDELAALAASTMEGALPLDVPLTVDLKVGTDWDRMDRLVPADGGYRVVSVDHAETEDEAGAVMVLADA
jgi:DNA polymerase I-like protein with 3'-5' exonuclease and polymerase domains